MRAARCCHQVIARLMICFAVTARTEGSPSTRAQREANAQRDAGNDARVMLATATALGSINQPLMAAEGGLSSSLKNKALAAAARSRDELYVMTPRCAVPPIRWRVQVALTLDSGCGGRYLQHGVGPGRTPFQRVWADSIMKRHVKQVEDEVHHHKHGAHTVLEALTRTRHHGAWFSRPELLPLLGRSSRG